MVFYFSTLFFLFPNLINETQIADLLRLQLATETETFRRIYITE